MNLARLALAASAAALLLAPAARAGDLGDAQASAHVVGRTATITLPYRAADKLIWVSSTKVVDAAPFMFKGLELKPHAGPGGLDLAVFTYVADRQGSASLSFGLVPPGKMLIGPPALVYRGPVSQTFKVRVTAQ